MASLMVPASTAALNGVVPENLPVISRPRTGAMAGGVCAGLARRWQVDPNLLRIAVVILTFFGGLGALAYGTGLLLMPREGSVEPPVRRLLPFTRNWTTPTVVVVTVTAAVVVAGLIGSRGIGIGPLAVIFCVWFFGFRGRGAAAKQPAPSPEPTPFERAADNWRQRLVEQQTPGYAPDPLAAPTVSAPPLAAGSGQRWIQPYTDPASDLAVRDDDLPVPTAAPPRPRRWGLWWLALGLVGSAVLALTVVGVVFGVAVGPLAYAAAVLAGLGATLLVATWAGRPPLLLPATIVAALVTGGLLAGASEIRPGMVGSETRTVAAEADLPSRLDVALGELTLDLSALELTSDRTIELHVGTGQLVLDLPDGVRTDVDWRVRTGEYRSPVVAEGERSGFDLTGTDRFEPVAGGPMLHVKAVVDLGELEVRP